jgi:adenosylcobinamide-phosphate synthase
MARPRKDDLVAVIQHRGPSIAAALLVDAILGELPVTIHPVVLMGRAISVFERQALSLEGARRQRLTGLLLAATLPAFSYALTRLVLRLPPLGLRWVLEVGLLSTSLSMRGLALAALAVERELKSGDLVAARTRVGELVGRDTEYLTPGGVARAAIESVAENASDGVVAPMFYGLLLGAPGALSYKAINTLDSMIGHPQSPYTDLGWASAHLDDFANLIPARLTALLAAAVSGSTGRVVATLSTARRYGPLTRSPNAGWVEAAFAGALGVALGGANAYGGIFREGPILGHGRSPEPDDIRRAVRLMRRACLVLTALVLVATFFRGSSGN